MEMALNDKGPKAFSITVPPGERFAEIVTSRVLADCLDLVLDYAREMMLQNTKHKSWKSLITTLKGFYRWLGQTEVITDSQARAALELLKNP
jgi:site-specific recombinase XerD